MQLTYQSLRLKAHLNSSNLLTGQVFPTHLRLGHLFTGEERTLPREHCTKVTLDNLSKLQVQLQSHQLAKVADTLFRANRYLGPNESKTWNYLLNRDRQPVSSGLDLHSDFDRFVEIDKMVLCIFSIQLISSLINFITNSKEFVAFR